MVANVVPPTPLVSRCVSINEPWAWAIVAGYKPIENRTWATPFRGRLAVHASTSKRHFTHATADYLFKAGQPIRKALDSELIDFDNPLFYFGAIVGTVEVVGCVFCEVDAGEDFDAACRAQGFGDWLERQTLLARRLGVAPPKYWADGPVCWLLESPQQFTVPIPSKGKLNIYSLSPPEVAAVAKAMRSPLGSPVEYRAKLLAAGGAKREALPSARGASA